MSEFEYSGTELALFSQAKNWKTYWSEEIAPFVGDCVLDVGAGIGTTARTLGFKAYKKWVGIEPDRNLCEIIRKKRDEGLVPPHVEIRCGTTFDLSRDEVFDTVLYIDVLEHIEDHQGELEQVSKNVSTGGSIIIVVPAHNFLYTDFDKKIGHFRRYDKKIMRSAIPGNLKIQRMRYLDSVGVLASLANKMLLKSDSPSAAQIQFWDGVMVPVSRLLDRLLGYRIGKSLVCILEKK